MLPALPTKAIKRSLVALGSLSLVALIGWRVLESEPFAPLASPAPTRGTSGQLAPREARPVTPHASGQGVMRPSLFRRPDPELAASLVMQIQSALRSRNDDEWNRVLNLLFPALLGQDCRAAARLLETLAADDRRDRLLRRLARAWAAVDFAGAMDWITHLSNASDQKMAFEDACFGAAETDPAEAIHAWETFDSGLDNNVLANLVQNWAGKDIDAVRAWLKGRPASPQRDQVVARIAFVMAQSQPVDAATFVTREIAPGPAQTEAVISVLQTWARRDMVGATAWAASFSEEPLRERAVGELAGIGPDLH